MAQRTQNASYSIHASQGSSDAFKMRWNF